MRPSKNLRWIRWLGLLAWGVGGAPVVAAEPGWFDEQRHPAASGPALAPAEAQKRFKAPPGFEVRLFAAEPQVINPAAMTWDERGRLWVVELIDYPHKAKAGEQGRDRIKILEDTDNDGRADKVTVFADGLSMATGLLLGRGGAFVGQAPELLFLRDTDGDDVADTREVLLTGFALKDTHETVNGFTWGPDGWMYMTHGVFNYSKVRAPDAPESEGNPFTAVVARYHPDQRRFEVFADGTSNPWGVDFDREGNAFVSACVIDHLFHMAPGGVYVRQAGVPSYPYAYGLLPSIADHQHFRAAYAGVQVYQGDQYPAAYRGRVMKGNIHGNSINQDRLTPVGSSFRASAEPDFLTTDDGWFRPVAEQVGPDGALWVMDWYDRYPCYQNAIADPAGVDRERGRIWRVVHVGGKPGVARPSRRPGTGDLGKARTAELVALLADGNVWHRRTAQRILSERRDPAARTPLAALLGDGKTLEARLAALWTLFSSRQLDDEALDRAAADRERGVRAWAARLTGEAGWPATDAGRQAASRRLARLAEDADPVVRAGVAYAVRLLPEDALLSSLTTAAAAPGTGGDPTLMFLLWRALEPRVAKDPAPFLVWARGAPAGAADAAGQLIYKTARRLLDRGDDEGRRLAFAVLRDVESSPAQVVGAAVRGLLEGHAGAMAAGAAGRAVFPALRRLAARPEPDVAAGAARLAAALGEPAALARLVAEARNAGGRAPPSARLAAIEVLGGLRTGTARAALRAAIGAREPDEIRIAALRALGRSGADGDAAAVLAAWRTMSPPVRQAAAQILATRAPWARALLQAVKRNAVAAGDVPVATRRALARHDDEAVKRAAVAVLGRVREGGAQMARLATDKKAVALAGPVDFANGHEQAKRACLLCHKFYGEGNEVGPDLTGVGRSTLDALIANVVDPNQVIGKGYEQVTVTTKDGRQVSGRLVEDSAQRVTLVGLNLRESLPRTRVARVDVGDVSVMPEGFDQLEDADFRDLMWFVYAPPSDPNARIRLEPRDKRLVVRGRLKPGAPYVDLVEYVMDPASRPYLHPVRDPSGRHALTDDRPSDHPWQHGVFTGLRKVGAHDFWDEKDGKQRFVRLVDAQVEEDRASWRAQAEWVIPSGEVLLEEEQRVTVQAPTAAGYTIDFTWTLRAPRTPVTMARFGYGGFAVRMPLDARHTHLNANGDKHKATSEQAARWCTVERPYDGEIWGLAVLDHPGNPGHPAKWRVDGQGLINPSPSLQGDWTIEGGRERTFRYRVVVYRDPADAARLEREFRAFAETQMAFGRRGEPR